MMAMRGMVILASVLSAGCLSIPANPTDMSPEQLREWAKDKNANIVCTIANTPYGKATVVFLTLDKGVVTSGQVTVDDACKITITNQPTNH